MATRLLDALVAERTGVLLMGRYAGPLYGWDGNRGSPRSRTSTARFNQYSAGPDPSAAKSRAPATPVQAKPPSQVVTA
ncbi:MAG: hypothetical protein ACK5MT_10230 [Actinomycetales bacterium]